MAEPLHVVAGAILDSGRVLLVSKRQAPDVFYLPGGKPDAGEPPLATLARELAEELGVDLVGSKLFGVISDEAALERTPMEMRVYLATVEGSVKPQAEIESVAWVGSDGASPGRLAPAIRNHVLPRLVDQRLIV